MFHTRRILNTLLNRIIKMMSNMNAFLFGPMWQLSRICITNSTRTWSTLLPKLHRFIEYQQGGGNSKNSQSIIQFTDGQPLFRDLSMKSYEVDCVIIIVVTSCCWLVESPCPDHWSMDVGGQLWQIFVQRGHISVFAGIEQIALWIINKTNILWWFNFINRIFLEYFIE